MTINRAIIPCCNRKKNKVISTTLKILFLGSNMNADQNKLFVVVPTEQKQMEKCLPYEPY